MTFWFNSPQSLSKREAEERLSEVSYYVLAKYWISLILFFFFLHVHKYHVCYDFTCRVYRDSRKYLTVKEKLLMIYWTLPRYLSFLCSMVNYAMIVFIVFSLFSKIQCLCWYVATGTYLTSHVSSVLYRLCGQCLLLILKHLLSVSLELLMWGSHPWFV